MKIIAILFLLLASMFAQGTFYNATQTPSRGDFIYPVAISPISMFAFSISDRNEEKHLYALDFRRDGGFFVYSGVISTTPISNLNIDNQINASVAAVSFIDNKHIVLLKSCGISYCEHALVTLDRTAKKVEYSTNIELDSCEYYYFQNKWLHSSCGQRVDTSLFLIEGYAEENFVFKGSIEDIPWTVIRTSGGGIQLIYNEEEYTIPFSSGEFISCDGKNNDTTLFLQCLSKDEENKFKFSIMSFSTVSREVSLLASSNIHTQSVKDEQPALRTFISVTKEHIFSSFVIGEDIYIHNRNDKGELHSERNFHLHFSKHVSPWVTEPSGFYAAQIVRLKDGRFYAPTFDFIPEESSPTIESSFPLEIFTARSLSIQMKVQDEDTPLNALKVSIEDHPDFISKDETSNELTYSPQHFDKGEHSYTITLEGRFNETKQTIPLKVTLTPFEALFYEPLLFKKVGLEDAYPIELFLQQIPIITFLEKDEINFSFSSSSRDDDEYEIEVIDKPSWMIYNESSKKIRGKPLQKDVGKSEISLRFIDRYSEEQKEHKIILEIQEINDPFEIISSGGATLKSGENYFYKLKIIDEETEVQDFKITPVLTPEWLKWDRGEMTLSGVAPSVNVAKEFNVQLIIEEVGFHVALHQFSVLVEPESNEKKRSGGGISIWFIALLFLVKLNRK